MQLSECLDVAAGPVCIVVRVQGGRAVQDLHLGLVELSRVEEVHCRRHGNGWLLTARSAASASPDPLLQAVAGLVDQYGPHAEVLDVRRGASELPRDSMGCRVSSRFRVTGGAATPTVDTIVLGAGQAFGTGAHPSTRLAAQAMEDRVGEDGAFPVKVLDVGTGTGILALVAARLGAREVLGIDICADAVGVARGNVTGNGLDDRIEVATTPLEAVTGRYDLVVSNVTASVLLRLADGIVGCMRPGAVLIVSGLQGRQADEAEAFLGRYGLTVASHAAEGKWRSLTLVLPDGD